MPLWLIIISLLTVGLLLNLFMRRYLDDSSGKRHPFKDTEDVDVRFSESRVHTVIPHGYIEVNGSRHLFKVIVTPDEVWITAPKFFKWIANMKNANHRFAIDAVSEIKLNNKLLMIAYRDQDNSIRHVELYLKDIDGFLNAIGQELI